MISARRRSTPRTRWSGAWRAPSGKIVVTTEGQVRACKVLKGLPFMNATVIEALSETSR